MDIVVKCRKLSYNVAICCKLSFLFCCPLSAFPFCSRRFKRLSQLLSRAKSRHKLLHAAHSLRRLQSWMSQRRASAPQNFSPGQERHSECSSMPVSALIHGRVVQEALHSVSQEDCFTSWVQCTSVTVDRRISDERGLALKRQAHNQIFCGQTWTVRDRLLYPNTPLKNLRGSHLRILSQEMMHMIDFFQGSKKGGRVGAKKFVSNCLSLFLTW